MEVILLGSNYHYHFIPERLDNEFLSDGHSSIVGYINDGFPLYGYKGERGVEMTNDDLDPCHGHKHGTLEYHYHATLEYPYTVGCYMGTPISSSSNGGPPPGPPPGGPPPGGLGGGLDLAKAASFTIGADGLGLISYHAFTNSALKVAHCENTFCSPYFRRR